MNTETSINVLNSIRSSIVANGSSLGYDERIPVATQDNLQDIGQAMLNYQPDLNAFLNELVNKIGLTYIHSKLYSNKLAFLKRGTLEYGDTVEEIYVDIAKAYAYVPVAPDDNMCDVYEQHKPEIISAFHKVNREDVYPITINNDLLKRAFKSYNNFSQFIASVFNSLYTADNLDEFLLFKQLIGASLKNSYQVQVTKPTDRTTSEQFSVQMRSYGLALEYMSRDYNQMGVANATPLEDQILILRSDIVPVIDVMQLANNFNLNLGQPISGRIIVIDDFGSGNDDIVAGIIDRDFSMIFDVLYRTESIYNPKHLYWNFYLHHHQVIASSPFANAVCFTTSTVTNAITNVEILPSEITIAKGYSGNVRAIVEFTGTIDTSVKYTIATATSDNTKVDEDGTIHIGADETASTLTVTATSVANSGKTATCTVTVVDDPQINEGD